MKLIYEGVEINLKILECKITDNIGDKADSIIISFADSELKYRQWNFKKNDCIEVIDGLFSTGKMYIDDFGCSNGKYTIKALSIKKKIKTKNTRAWENVRFLDLAKDLVKEEGLNLKTYGIENYIYERVDKDKRNNIDFLNFRCMLEGYNLKISNNEALIISETFLEEQIEEIIIYKEDMINKYDFKTTSNNIISGCEIIYNSDFLVKGRYINRKFNGEILKINDIQTYNIVEANRFCKNIFKKYNKYETIGKFTIKKNTNISAGNTIKILDLELFNGKYIIEKVIHDLVNNQSRINVRKVNVYE